MASLRAQMQTNRLNYQRYQDLARQGAASALQRDEFRQAYIAAREALVAKEADLDPDFARKFLNFIIAEVIRHHRQHQS